MIGQTYGKCTYNSSTGNYDKGIDLNPDKKFKSTFQKEYVDQNRVDYEPASKIAGVVGKEEDKYRRPITDHHKFWGTETRDEVSDQVQLQKNTKMFYQADHSQGTQRQKVQSKACLLYTSPSPRDQRGSRMPSSA